jgi:hypothetical protein
MRVHDHSQRLLSDGTGSLSAVDDQVPLVGL